MTPSLATRCPACHTVFRVVQDQLRVSEGWVRCGRCAEVFNATLTLVDIDGGPIASPPPVQTSAAAAAIQQAPAQPSPPLPTQAPSPPRPAFNQAAGPAPSTGYRDSDSPFAATAPLFGAPQQPRDGSDLDRLLDPVAEPPFDSSLEPSFDPRLDPPFEPQPAPAPSTAVPAYTQLADDVAHDPPDDISGDTNGDTNGDTDGTPDAPPADNPETQPADWPEHFTTPAEPSPHTVEAAMAMVLAPDNKPKRAEPAPWAPDSQLDGEAFTRPTIRVPPATAYASALSPMAGLASQTNPRPRWSGETPQGPVPLQEPGFDGDDGPLYGSPPSQAGGKTSKTAAGAAGFDEQAEAAAEGAATPSFVRDAERAQRWHSPRRRALLASLALLATLALLAQVALQYRDLVAARMPALRPLLVQACAALGCRVDAARSIDSLVVESSGLVRQGRSNVYKLQLQLRNRAGIDVALPALDVTLTDVRGAIIARKVLQGGELGLAQTTVGAGRDVALVSTLQTGAATGEPIAGYTVELFYP